MSYESQIIQALTMIITLLISVYVQYINKPYKKKELNAMEIKALLVSTVTIYCSIYFLADSLDGSWMTFVSLFILFGNSYFLVLWVYYMAKSIIEFAVERIKILKYWFKKGDAYKEDMYTNSIYRKGVINKEDESNDMTLFNMKSRVQKNKAWKYANMETLFKDSISDSIE